MEKWKTMPKDIPLDADIVWCRLDYWFGAPFLAYWVEAQQSFVSLDNSLIFPCYEVSRWRAQ